MSTLIDALDMMDNRKRAVGGERGFITGDPKRDLALVASGFDLDLSELLKVAFVCAEQLAKTGVLHDMPPGETMVSCWLDGFMIGLAHAKLQREADDEV